MTPFEILSARVRSAAADLEMHDVHVWSAPIEGSDDALPFMELLDDAERVRSTKYRFSRHKNAFLTSRSLTRLVLGGYLGCDASMIRFSYSRYGRPGIEYPAQQVINFNVSHTDSRLLIAVGSQSHLGVDIEQLHRSDDISHAVLGCLSATETECLTHVHQSTANPLLLRYWTHKEAYLKARGVGLSAPLKKVEVAFLSDKLSRIHSIIDGSDITLHGFDLGCGVGYVAALATDVLNRLVQFEL